SSSRDSNRWPSPSSFSSGADSDYESEGCRSASPSQRPGGSSAASPPCGRRSRTAFTAEQIRCLERSFKRNAYLGTQDKAELCRKLHLSDKQVRNWFQNRRMKMKRSMQDALAQACQAGSASQLLLYPDLQAYRARTFPVCPAVVAPDGPAPYGPPHGLRYGSPLPLDSFYQYGGFPGVVLPSGPPHYRAPYCRGKYSTFYIR
uniref:Ventrally expressed dharma/bozozok antagonist n=1 Tax=Salarias fasciatus TaxID=181472 RepID=A0A672HUB4_SALFA